MRTIRKMTTTAGLALLFICALTSCSSARNDVEQTAPATRRPLRDVPTLTIERISSAAPSAVEAIAVEPPTSSRVPSTAKLVAPSTTVAAPTPAAVEIVPAPTAPAPTAKPTAPPSTSPTPQITKPRPFPTTATAPETNAPAATEPAATTPPAPPTSKLAKKSTRSATTVPTTIPIPVAPTLSAPPVAPGFDGKTIRIGVLTTTTNATWGQIGKALYAGIEARFTAINKNGGIAGKYRVEIIRTDTNYDPTLTAQQLDQTKDDVVGYASILGTPNVEAIEPTLRQLQMVAGAASQEARWANRPNVLPVFNSYQVQAINGIGYFLETTGKSDATICSLSVSTSYGDAGAEGVRFAKAQMNFNLGPMETTAPTNTNVTANIGALKNAGCQAVMLTTTPQQTLAAVLTGRALAFSPRWIIMGASFSDRLVVPATGPLFEQGAWVVGDGTQWGDTTVPGMAQLANELLASDNRYWTENPDIGLTYGWVQAKVMEATLERAVARNDLSHAGVLAAAHEIGPVDVGGLGSPIDYSAPQRLANARITVFAVDGSYRNAIRVLAPGYTTAAAKAYRPA